MTSGVSGSSNSDPTLAAQLAQTANQAAGKEGKAPAGSAEEVAAGFEDLIQESSPQGTSKKEGTRGAQQTKSAGKADKAEKTAQTAGAASTTSVSSASSTATAQAVKGPKGPGQNNYELPQLPEPANASVNGVVIKKGMGTLSLMGLIMTLLAQSSAKSWSSSFQQQNQAIQNQVAMAPKIGEAIRSQANSQASATEAQAKQSMISGITNLVGFSVAVGGGLLSASRSLGGIKSASFTKQTGQAANTAKQAATTQVGQAAAKGANAASTAGMSPANVALRQTYEKFYRTMYGKNPPTSSLGGGIAKAGTEAATGKGNVFAKLLNNPDLKSKLSRGANVAKTQLGRAAGFAGKALSASMQTMQLIHAITAGVDGIAGGILGSEVAHHQRQAGMAEARAEELKQLSSVQSQYAGQAQSLQDQAQQSFNSALQTLQSVSDSQTQTTSAIFS